MTGDYLELNRANWDQRAPIHAASAEYEGDRFRTDPDHLSSEVRFDSLRLGDISGRRCIHLQCHIGIDTLSLHRLGAQMTGLDFSGESLDHARQLAEHASAAIRFVQSDIYDAITATGDERYELVYTGIGALCWLPDIRKWAVVIAALLEPGGRLFLREAHPMLWAIDESQRDRLVVGFPYFEESVPMMWDESVSYVESDTPLTATVTHEWNHGLGEIISALLESGMRIDQIEEHRSIPWEALPGRMSRGDDGEWRLDKHAERLPLSYTLQAVKA